MNENKNMFAALLADFILILHLAFILFAMLGGLLVIYRRWFVWLHIPALCWASLISFMGWICPLTPMENYFREQAGEYVYSQSFIGHYLLPLIYPSDLTRDIQISLGVFVILWNGVIYFGHYRFKWRHK